MIIFNIYLIISMIAFTLNFIKGKNELRKDIIQEIAEADGLLIELEEKGYEKIAYIFRYAVESALNNNALPSIILIFLISFIPIINIFIIWVRISAITRKENITKKFEELIIYNNENIITREQISKFLALAQVIKLPEKIYINERIIDILRNTSNIDSLESEGWCNNYSHQIGINIYNLGKKKTDKQINSLYTLLYNLKLYEELDDKEAEKFATEFINNNSTEISQIMDWKSVVTLDSIKFKTNFKDITLYNNENIITNDQLSKIVNLSKIIKLPIKIYINENRIDSFKHIPKIKFYLREGWYYSQPFQIGINLHRIKKDKPGKQLHCLLIILYNLKLYEGLNFEQAKESAVEFLNNNNSEISEIMGWNYTVILKSVEIKAVKEN